MFLGGFYYITFSVDDTTKKDKMIQVSVIIRGKSDSNWITIKQGIDRASSDFNVNVNFITLTEENRFYEQESLIKREIANGTDAILISAANSIKLSEVVDLFSQKIPIVAIESPVETKKTKDYISASNVEMGECLANEIITNGIENQKISIVSGAKNCTNISIREDKILECVKDAGGNIYKVKTLDDLSDVSDITQNLILQDKVDIIVATDPATLQIAAHTIFALKASHVIKIYGFGSNGVITSYLEKGVISAIIVQNDFSIGYLGIKAAVNAIRGTEKYKSELVDYKLITSQNMYDKDIQKLVFPYVR